MGLGLCREVRDARSLLRERARVRRREGEWEWSESVLGERQSEHTRAKRIERPNEPSEHMSENVFVWWVDDRCRTSSAVNTRLSSSLPRSPSLPPTPPPFSFPFPGSSDMLPLRCRLPPRIQDVDATLPTAPPSARSGGGPSATVPRIQRDDSGASGASPSTPRGCGVPGRSKSPRTNLRPWRGELFVVRGGRGGLLGEIGWRCVIEVVVAVQQKCGDQIGGEKRECGDEGEDRFEIGWAHQAL